MKKLYVLTAIYLVYAGWMLTMDYRFTRAARAAASKQEQRLFRAATKPPSSVRFALVSDPPIVFLANPYRHADAIYSEPHSESMGQFVSGHVTARAVPYNSDRHEKLHAAYDIPCKRPKDFYWDVTNQDLWVCGPNEYGANRWVIVPTNGNHPVPQSQAEEDYYHHRADAEQADIQGHVTSGHFGPLEANGRPREAYRPPLRVGK